ncbi:MAG: hypothetical protein NZ888_02205 [Candidatus Nitrosocaldus sp.]|nr:hypothetical protein [Candidatus Nitrosocaldus sp.]MDW7999941.1 hypothetical protein [Candidatus Nitrosocaldus sp.]
MHDIAVHASDLILLLYIAFVFGINNAGITVMGMLASGFNYRRSAGVAVLGFMTGALLEGWKMGGVIMLEDHIDTVTYAVTAAMLSIFSLLNMPVSMVNIMFAGYVGGVASTCPISISHVAYVIAAWIIAPFIALIATMAIYHLILRSTALLSLADLSRFYSIMMPPATFYASYAIGANNLGLLYSMGSGYTTYGIYMMPAVLAVFSAGVVMGKGVSRFLSEDIVGYTPATVLSGISACSIILWVSTQIRIPLPFSQMLIGSLIGINMVRRPHVYNKRSLLLLVSSWIGSTLLSLTITSVITMTMA